MFDIFIFILSLIGLSFGANVVTKGALGLARRWGLSESFLGMSLLSLGTCLPEIMVSLTAAYEQEKMGVSTSGIVIGNVIGANMSTMVFVLGAVGLLGTVTISKKKMQVQGPALIISTVLFLILASDGVIGRQDGIIFLFSYLVYFLILNRVKEKARKPEKHQILPYWKILLFLLGGIFFVSEASQQAIQAGIRLALDLGISQLVVGAILLGLGTTLPELTIALKAKNKEERDLSLGNLIGSNVVDVFIVLGFGALITEWKIDRQVVQFDIPFLLLSMTIVTLFMLSRGKLDRKESLLMLSLYGIYIALKVMGW